MAVKRALESLKYTYKAIESYECVKRQTIELYESVGYTSDIMHQMIDYTEKQIKKEQSHYNYWHNLINEIEDDRYRDILIMRYIDDETVEKVAEKLFYTVSHTYRLSKKAVRAVNKAHSKAYKG